MSSDSRRYPSRPIASVGGVLIDRGQVLLVRRAHPPLQGQWSLPGGSVEVGETLENAVIRELAEETGLTVRVGPVIEVLDRVQHDAEGHIEYHFVIVDYLCHLVSGTLAPSSDAADARWVPIADVMTRLVDDRSRDDRLVEIRIGHEHGKKSAGRL